MKPQQSAQANALKSAQSEQKPPYCYVLLDEQSVCCLALGVVNARAQVQAQRVAEALYGFNQQEKT